MYIGLTLAAAVATTDKSHGAELTKGQCKRRTRVDFMACQGSFVIDGNAGRYIIQYDQDKAIRCCHLNIVFSIVFARR